jgi:hypothetical protein
MKPIFEPFLRSDPLAFGAVTVSTAFIGRALMTAMVTDLKISTEGSGTATLNIAQRFSLLKRKHPPLR